MTTARPCEWVTVLKWYIWPWPLCSSLDVPFPSSREADIALQSLSPDREPRKGGIEKQLTLSGSTLSVWEACFLPPWTVNSFSVSSAKLLLCSCGSGGGERMKPGSSECPWTHSWIIFLWFWKPWRCLDPLFLSEMTCINTSLTMYLLWTQLGCQTWAEKWMNVTRTPC